MNKISSVFGPTWQRDRAYKYPASGSPAVVTSYRPRSPVPSLKIAKCPTSLPLLKTGEIPYLTLVHPPQIMDIASVSMDWAPSVIM